MFFRANVFQVKLDNILFEVLYKNTFSTVHLQTTASELLQKDID